MVQIIEYAFLQGFKEKYWSMAYLIYTAVHIAFSKKNSRSEFLFWLRGNIRKTEQINRKE